VLSAASGPAALELARAHEGRIDLLLTDIVMPGMTGPELFSRLASERPALKVLLMSGYAGARSRGDSSLEGELPFIQKPVGFAALRRRIEEVLRVAPDPS